MDMYKELSTILHSKIKLKFLLKDIDNAAIYHIIQRINELLEEKEKTKYQSIIKIHRAIEKSGLSLDEIKNFKSRSKPSEKEINARKTYNFSYALSSGEQMSWCGPMVGRLPKQFQIYLQKTGKERSSCIVVK